MEPETKSIEVDWKMPDGITVKKAVVIRKLTLGQKARLRKNILKPQRIDDKVELLPDLEDMIILPILMCVVEAPWAVNNIEAVRMLPDEVGETVYKAVADFNNLNESQKKSSETPSSTEP